MYYDHFYIIFLFRRSADVDIGLTDKSSIFPVFPIENSFFWSRVCVEAGCGCMSNINNIAVVTDMGQCERHVAETIYVL